MSCSVVSLASIRLALDCLQFINTIAFNSRHPPIPSDCRAHLFAYCSLTWPSFKSPSNPSGLTLRRCRHHHPHRHLSSVDTTIAVLSSSSLGCTAQTPWSASHPLPAWSVFSPNQMQRCRLSLSNESMMKSTACGQRFRAASVKCKSRGA